MGQIMTHSILLPDFHCLETRQTGPFNRHSAVDGLHEKLSPKTSGGLVAVGSVRGDQ